MPFIRPENALKRAEEFIEVGKKQRALDTLYEVICSKKNRSWSKTNEQIIKNFLHLCVELKESHMAKDGLHQYKNMCQNNYVKSLEEVINSFLQQAEERAEKAKKVSSDANVLADVDDLENINSPESLLLKAVSGESSQDRADRDLLAPWLKFVWESYKNCLELLKNNSKIENLYRDVTKLAFAFCVKYQRKTEFRKLCETIRQHMFQAQKYPNLAAYIDLSKAETQNNHMETRMFQLNHAISMELWQEAYKAVEDIYHLMNLSRNKPKPIQMFNYYSKLSLIFWKANNYLFHAATLQKLFVLLKEQKKTMTQEELTKVCTGLLLATLAIPIPPNRSSIDEALDQDETTIEKLKRLSSLLNLQQPPTRLSLLKDLQKYNVVQHVYPEIRDLYKSLEVDFNPLKLSDRVNKCLDYIESRQDMHSEYLQYVQPIKEITVTRLVKQIAQIYTSIEIERFVQLAPKGVDLYTLEKLTVDSAKQLDLQVRINHQSKSLHFGNDLYVAQKDDLPEGPSIQNMPSEQIRNQLIAMNDALQQARQLIYANETKASMQQLAQNIALVYRQTHEKQHIDLLRRKQMIEKQKEMYEMLAMERERIKNEKKKQEERELAISKQRQHAEEIVQQQEEREQQVQEVISKEDEEITRQIEQANKERREFLERLKKEEKKFDHFVRACHENEIALIKKFADDDAQTRKKYWDEKELERIENAKKELQIQAENKERLLRMVGDKDQFVGVLHSARQQEFEKRMKEFQSKLESAREAKLRERKEQRTQDRRTAFVKQQEEKKRREDEERRRKEDEEKRRKQDETLERQRQREREIEEKMAKERQSERDRDESERKQKQPTSAAPAGSSAPYRPRAAGGSGFAGPIAAASAASKPDEGVWRRAGPADAEESATTTTSTSGGGGGAGSGAWRPRGPGGGAPSGGRQGGERPSGDSRKFGGAGGGGSKFGTGSGAGARDTNNADTWRRRGPEDEQQQADNRENSRASKW